MNPTNPCSGKNVRFTHPVIATVPYEAFVPRNGAR